VIDLDVSIIIVSYNTRELTLECLRSLYRETEGVFFEVLVVDNASKDGSAQAIADEFEHVRLMSLEENAGFGGGCNLAAREARGQYLLFLNPDTVVLNGAVQKLVACARRYPEAGLYGGRTYWGDRSLNPTSCWRRPTPWSAFCRAVGLDAIFRSSALFDPESYGRWQRDSDREVDIITGCLLLVEHQAWAKLRGFDPMFFQRGEDADLSLRAWTLGYRPRICPEAEIIHYGGQSERVLPDKVIRNLKAKQMLFDRFWSPGGARFGSLMQKLWVLTRYLAWRLAGHREKLATYREVWQRRREFGRQPARELPPEDPGVREAVSRAGEVPAPEASVDEDALIERDRASRLQLPTDEQAGYLDAGDERVYYFRHRARGSCRGAVLLIGPFGVERIYAYSSLVSWARRLALEGFEVLRFDYRGTGESTGQFEEMSLESWLEDIALCHEFLRELTGDVPLVLQGLRMGALLGARCFGEGKADAVLLWDPPASGEKMLKEVLRGKLAEDMALGIAGERKNRDAYIAEIEAGDIVEVDGYPWSRRLWESARQFDLMLPPEDEPRPWQLVRLARSAKRREVEPGKEWRIPVPVPPFWCDKKTMVPDLSDLFEQSLGWTVDAISGGRETA
jgi:GT2 family glycosyltransferase/pimeloyl-ACP methyl ester carboxylesterase